MSTDTTPQPELAEVGQVQPAGVLGDVGQRVGARVPVVGGVGQLSHPAGVEDDDGGAATAIKAHSADDT